MRAFHSLVLNTDNVNIGGESQAKFKHILPNDSDNNELLYVRKCGSRIQKRRGAAILSWISLHILGPPVSTAKIPAF